MRNERDLTLFPRREGTRSIDSIKVFTIDEIEEHFHESLNNIERKFTFAKKLQTDGNIEEAMDVWRTQLIFLESAFDFYMHEITKLGIISIFNDEWNGDKSTKYLNLSFTMGDLEKALNDRTGDSWLKEWMNIKYSSVTMMSYEALRNVCHLLSLDTKYISDEVFYEQGDTVKTHDKLKTFMDKLHQRRNMIAHQSDRKIENAIKEKIEECDVKYYLDTMQKIVSAISQEIRKKIG